MKSRKVSFCSKNFRRNRISQKAGIIEGQQQESEKLIRGNRKKFHREKGELVKINLENENRDWSKSETMVRQITVKLDL